MVGAKKAFSDASQRVVFSTGKNRPFFVCNNNTTATVVVRVEKKEKTKQKGLTSCLITSKPYPPPPNLDWGDHEILVPLPRMSSHCYSTHTHTEKETCAGFTPENTPDTPVLLTIPYCRR